MELENFHNQWVVIVDKGYKNFQSLSIDERVWFTVQRLIGDVCNGGLISHYYNSGADYNRETIEDIRLLGFDDIADLLILSNKIFTGEDYICIDIYERNDVISTWPDGKYEEFFNQADKKFYDRQEELEKSLVQHIITKVIKLKNPPLDITATS